MLLVSGTNASGSSGDAVRMLSDSVTHIVVANILNSGVPGFGGSLDLVGSRLANAQDVHISPRQRWRASKGSAPVNRFTRSFGNNQTEGWHRTMPVATVTVVTVPVPAVFLRALAVQPAVSAGSATVAAPATTIKLIAVAPSVAVTTQVAVPSSRITLNAVAPARTATVTLTVPAVAVRDVAIAPTVVPGTRAITPTPVAIRLLAVAPQVQNFILVPAATLRLGAIAPSVTGGGGGGGGIVTLRKSGD